MHVEAGVGMNGHDVDNEAIVDDVKFAHCLVDVMAFIDAEEGNDISQLT